MPRQSESAAWSVLRQMMRGATDEILNRPLTLILGVIAAISTFSGGAIVIGNALPDRRAAQQDDGFLADAPTWPIELQVVVLMLFMAGFGWLFGLIVVVLARLNSVLWRWLLHLVAICLSALAAGFLRWLASELPSVAADAMTLLSLGAIILLCRLLFSTFTARDSDEAAGRAGAMLTFTGVLVAFSLLNGTGWS